MDKLIKLLQDFIKKYPEVRACITWYDVKEQGDVTFELYFNTSNSATTYEYEVDIVCEEAHCDLHDFCLGNLMASLEDDYATYKYRVDNDWPQEEVEED